MRLKKLLALLLISIPFGSVARAAINAGSAPGSIGETTWDEVAAKLVNNRLPPEYYIFLATHGITSVNELYLLDDRAKEELVNKYSQDKAIILASDKFRSVT